MHLRKLVLACGLASFTLSQYASALGLGEVKLNSKLNQPLSAEVKLLDTRDLSAEQILIALASPADFERNGVERLYFYTEFQFEVVLDNPGGPVVKVTSRNPVREPYLNFLIEARWTAGRLLREYTLLMDLPTFDDAAPKTVQAPAAAKTAPVKPAAEVKPKTSPAVTAPTEEKPLAQAQTEEKPDIIAEQEQPAKKSKGSSSGTYGPIEANDTLWEIAKSVRPDSSVSVHQTMMALHRLNPDAFIHGNINLLKKGQVLRVPDASEAASVSKSEALNQFNTQNAEWSSGTSSTSTALGAQLDATHHTSGARHQDEPVSGRVKLEAPSAAGKGSSGQASGSNKGSGKALESELAATLEELDKAKSEKTELSSRVRDLEAQVKTMQRLVDVSNEKLRAMQLSTAKQAEKPADKSGEKPAEKPVAKPETVATVSSAVTSSAEAAAPASSAAANSSVAPAVKKPPVVVPPPAEKSIVDTLTDNAPFVGLGALVLAGAGFFFARRRKAQAEAAAHEADESDLFTNEPDFAAFNESQDDSYHEETPTFDEAPAFEEEEVTAVAETGDVVGEADIYIAYGKYDQAEEMLLNGLAKDPQSTDIRLKLLEVYSQTQNLADFDKHFGIIKSSVPAFTLNRVAELRANIPGAGSFEEPSPAAIPEPDAVEDTGFDLDLDLDSPVSEAAPESAEDEEFSFDLDLDDTLTAESDVQLPEPNYDMDLSEPKQESSITDLDDDFTLDLDDADVSTAEDLSEISLALDDLKDNRTLLSDAELEADASEEEEFSFDFNDIEEESSQLASEVESIKAPQLDVTEDTTEDFNLDMDVADVDLAALDQEMNSFDADLAILDDDVPAGSANEFTANNDLVSLDSDFAEDELLLEADDSDLDFEEPITEQVAEFEALDAELNDEELGDEGLELDLAEELDDKALDDEDLALLDEELAEEAVASEAELVADEFAVNDLEDDFNLDDDSFTASAPESDFAELDAALGDDDFNLADVSDDLKYEPAALTAEDEELFAAEELATETAITEDAAEEVLALDDFEEVPVAEVTPVAQEPELSLDDIADDDVFEQALSDFSSDDMTFDASADMSDDDMDAELDFMADADEAATKLDLARAYIDMGDNEGARDILAEVAHEGNDEQRQEAADLLSRIDA